jgi:hypothetical protein
MEWGYDVQGHDEVGPGATGLMCCVGGRKAGLRSRDGKYILAGWNHDGARSLRGCVPSPERVFYLSL